MLENGSRALNLSDVLRRELRSTVDPIVRAHGFKGSCPRWSRSNGDGDVAVVQIVLSPWNSSDQACAEVALALVPLPHWEYIVEKYGPKRPAENHGLYRSWVTPATGSNWCCTDEASAAVAGRHLAALLPERVERLVELLDRETYIDQIRAGGGVGENPMYDTATAEVIMLSDKSGPELDAACKRLLTLETERVPAWAEEWVRWARKRAASRG